MSQTHKIEVKGRPVTKSYGLVKGQIYPKKKVKAQERKIATLWTKKYGRFQWFSDEDLAFSVRAYYPDKQHGDLKNLIFLAEDALSGVAYEDDKQIVRYAPPPGIFFCEEGEEKTEVFVKGVEND